MYDVDSLFLSINYITFNSIVKIWIIIRKVADCEKYKKVKKSCVSGIKYF